jgi:hypothetical protein
VISRFINLFLYALFDILKLNLERMLGEVAVTDCWICEGGSALLLSTCWFSWDNFPLKSFISLAEAGLRLELLAVIVDSALGDEVAL